MAAPSFSDVARAFSPDFTGIADEAFRGRQLAQQANQFNAQMERKREDDRNQYLSKIADIKPSDTPYDSYAIPKFRQLQTDIASYIRENPRARQSDIEARFGQNLRDTQYGLGVASSLNKQLSDNITNAAKDNAVLDQNIYRNDVLKSIYYDENGNLRPIPDGNAMLNPQYDLRDPERLAHYSNPQLVNTEFAKRFKEGFTANPTTYEAIDPSTGMRVPYTQDLSVFDRPTQDGINRERGYNNISVGNRQYNLLSEEQAALFPQDNITRASLLNARKRYAEDEAFASLPKGVQDRIIAADLVDANIGSISYKDPKFDYSGLRFKEAKEQNDINNSYKAANLGLARKREARLARQQARAEAAKEKVGDNKLIDIFNYNNNEDNDGTNLEELRLTELPSISLLEAAAPHLGSSTKKYIDSRKWTVASEGIGKRIDIMDISKGVPSGVIKNKDGSGGNIKSYLLRDRATRKTVLVEQAIAPQKIDKDGTVQPMRILNTRVIYDPTKMKGQIKSYQSDFKLKEGDLDEYFDAQEADSDPTEDTE